MTLPVGTRFLRGIKGPFSDKVHERHECWVLEFSPSGRHVKIGTEDGGAEWIEAGALLIVEVLAPQETSRAG